MRAHREHTCPAPLGAGGEVLLLGDGADDVELVAAACCCRASRCRRCCRCCCCLCTSRAVVDAIASVAELRSTMLYVHTKPLSGCVQQAHAQHACRHDLRYACLKACCKVSKHQARSMATPSSPGVVPEMLQQRLCRLAACRWLDGGRRTEAASVATRWK